MTDETKPDWHMPYSLGDANRSPQRELTGEECDRLKGFVQNGDYAGLETYVLALLRKG